MKGHEAKNRADEAITRLQAELAAGRSEALSAYLRALAHFHRYSFHNVMLIASQRPDASRVSGFRTWKTLGRHVKKGEKGIVIIAPRPFKRETAQGEDEHGLSFRAVYVFDIAQTEGEDLPEFARVHGDRGAYRSRLEAFLATKSIRLRFASDLGGPDGTSTGGEIVIREGLPAGETFSVMVHETAHELLHHSGEEKAPKVVRETEAEAVAYIVSQAIGLETNRAASDYIQLYQGTTETLTASLERIREASAQILECILDADDAGEELAA